RQQIGVEAIAGQGAGPAWPRGRASNSERARFGDETLVRAAIGHEGVLALRARIMLRRIDGPEAPVDRKAGKRIAERIAERTEAWRNVEGTAERMPQHDAGQLAPAIVFLVGRPGKGNGEVGTSESPQPVREAGQDD